MLLNLTVHLQPEASSKQVTLFFFICQQCHLSILLCCLFSSPQAVTWLEWHPSSPSLLQQFTMIRKQLPFSPLRQQVTWRQWQAPHSSKLLLTDHLPPLACSWKSPLSAVTAHFLILQCLHFVSIEAEDNRLFFSCTGKRIRQAPSKNDAQRFHYDIEIQNTSQ